MSSAASMPDTSDIAKGQPAPKQIERSSIGKEGDGTYFVHHAHAEIFSLEIDHD
jgi:hypothetical protein